MMIRLALATSALSLALGVVPVAAGAGGPPPPMSGAALKRVEAELLKLEFGTRVVQRCNVRAMGVVRREHWPMNPDEGVPAAFAEPDRNGVELHATGAAIRAGGNWYRIAYDCVTSPDGLDIKSFRYALGDVIPKSEWKAHDLVAR